MFKLDDGECTTRLDQRALKVNLIEKLSIAVSFLPLGASGEFNKVSRDSPN